jgi:hypothetical protein
MKLIEVDGVQAQYLKTFIHIILAPVSGTVEGLCPNAQIFGPSGPYGLADQKFAARVVSGSIDEVDT